MHKKLLHTLLSHPQATALTNPSTPAAATNADDPTRSGGGGRLLSLFSIVTFKAAECNAASSATLTGVCVSASECSARRATSRSDGTCASGFGVCCVTYTDVCGGTVYDNCSYIRVSFLKFSRQMKN